MIRIIIISIFFQLSLINANPENNGKLSARDLPKLGPTTAITDTNVFAQLPSTTRYNEVFSTLDLFKKPTVLSEKHLFVVKAIAFLQIVKANLAEINLIDEKPLVLTTKLVSKTSRKSTDYYKQDCVKNINNNGLWGALTPANIKSALEDTTNKSKQKSATRCLNMHFISELHRHAKRVLKITQYILSEIKKLSARENGKPENDSAEKKVIEDLCNQAPELYEKIKQQYNEKIALPSAVNVAIELSNKWIGLPELKFDFLYEIDVDEFLKTAEENKGTINAKFLTVDRLNALKAKHTNLPFELKKSNVLQLIREEETDPNVLTVEPEDISIEDIVANIVLDRVILPGFENPQIHTEFIKNCLEKCTELLLAVKEKSRPIKKTAAEIMAKLNRNLKKSQESRRKKIRKIAYRLQMEKLDADKAKKAEELEKEAARTAEERARKEEEWHDMVDKTLKGQNDVIEELEKNYKEQFKAINQELAEKDEKFKELKAAYEMLAQQNSDQKNLLAQLLDNLNEIKALQQCEVKLADNVLQENGDLEEGIINNTSETKKNFSIGKKLSAVLEYAKVESFYDKVKRNQIDLFQACSRTITSFAYNALTKTGSFFLSNAQRANRQSLIAGDNAV